MPDTARPTVPERQRVDRLVAAVLSGLDPHQAVGAAVTDRLGIVTAVMQGEAADKVDFKLDGSVHSLNAPEYRRYLALSDLFEAMAQRAAGLDR